jgi:hypothetical protein
MEIDEPVFQKQISSTVDDVPEVVWIVYRFVLNDRPSLEGREQ